MTYATMLLIVVLVVTARTSDRFASLTLSGTVVLRHSSIEAAG